MFRMRLTVLPCLALLLVLGGIHCARKKGTGFKPGKLVPFEEKKLGFSIEKPDNVRVVVTGNTAELKADGFPRVTITLHKTRKVTTGSAGRGGMGKYKRQVYAPMRKLVCQCDATGEHEALIEKICGSLKNTRAAPKHPKVKFDAPRITGKLRNAEAYRKALKLLEPRIVECWKKAVAKDAKFPSGDVNVQITYKPDGSKKQWGLTRTFNYKGDKPLADCVEKLVVPLKPDPDGEEVALGWYLRFALYDR